MSAAFMDLRMEAPPAESVEHARQQLNRLIEAISRLAETAPPPDKFYPDFLHQLLGTLGVPAGAVWEATPDGGLRLCSQVNRDAIGIDHIPLARACHDELLRQVLCQRRAQVVAPDAGPAPSDPSPANLTGHTVILSPALLDGDVAGVVEIWLVPGAEPIVQQRLLQLLVLMADFVAAYRRNLGLRQAKTQEHLWNQLEGFTRQIHSSLDPQEVAYLVAIGGRALVDCDRLSVVVRQGRQVEIEAVSGADTVERRSRQVRAMRKLSEAVLDWGERLVYRGRAEDGLPPKVRQALDAYLAESHSRVLIVAPLDDLREMGGRRPRCSALVAESFGPMAEPEPMIERLQVVARHAAPALYNAVEYRRVPLHWLWRPVSAAEEGVGGWRTVRWAALALLLVAAVGALVLVPCPLRMDAQGQLVPRERQTVFATIPGKIVQMRARHGDRVARDQELLLMEDVELQQKVRQLEVRMEAAGDSLSALAERLNQTTNDEERHTLKLEQIKQRYERRKAEVERDLILRQTRRPLEAAVLAPRDGTVVTFDVHEQLLGKTVKPGDPLLRIARLQGPWEVELHLPEASVGPVREALARQPGGELAVDFLLVSHPEQVYHGVLRAAGLGGETRVENNAVVLPASVEIRDPALEAQLAQMPVGVEVRAKVHCGQRALGYAWFFGLWEFLHEHLFF